MPSSKLTGSLLVAGSVAVLIPYSILTKTFDYPDILREDTSVLLTKFHDGGSGLILTWFAFALSGLPLIPAFILLGRILRSRSSLVRVATTFGVVGLVVQMVGLLRWTFVVPILSDIFMNTNDTAMKSAVVVTFKAVHQYGGVVLGEHIGQLFTIFWTVLISMTFAKLKSMPKWIVWSGYVTAFIYLMAQAELLATVIHGFPYWSLAGVIGSTLWIAWMIVIGIRLLNNPISSSRRDPA
ncbi:MAG: DUF4386 domain-containing protein [Chitinophagaceae bacterium]|nr:DUF4386 domain-containing protein [Chitinophagaceae bacterium]